MELSVFDTKGSEVKKVSARDEVFAVEVKQSVIHGMVRWQRAKQRAGTHATLNLGRMAGGGRKPFKQKGLGRARAGSRNSPLWVGGAVSFGPQPRDYSFKLPRKVRRQALLGVLSDKASRNEVTILSGFDVEQPKTKAFADILGALKLSKIEEGRKRAKKVAFLFAEGEEAAAISARNISTVSILPVAAANVYDLVHVDHILFSERAFDELQDRLIAQIEGRAGEGSAVEAA
ncbi:MAG: 50S ribosomal protein L4 [Bdellovibrionales bacterium]|nr:50S ribosomal protein L4 [Bdellovibrionales bacterium]